VTHPLDDPVRASLTGPHAHLAQRQGDILAYPPDVATFISIHENMVKEDWDDVAELVRRTGRHGAVFAGVLATPPADWIQLWGGPGIQLVGDQVKGQPDEEAVRLGPADVPEMLALVERTQPGPFAPRTIELGTFLGIRRDGTLVAMAGQRFNPPGWAEVSAVCTDDAYRGQGLAARLIRAVAADIREHGAEPFLHVADWNTGALRLYEALGFQRRRVTEFAAYRPPAED
jgi:ribosomal protein S18 acetylase RimI-like enzyme